MTTGSGDVSRVAGKYKYSEDQINRCLTFYDTRGTTILRVNIFMFCLCELVPPSLTTLSFSFLTQLY